MFGPESYRRLIAGLKDAEFSFSNDPYLPDDQSIFLRHDVDLSLRDAANIAEIDQQLGISSCFFILCNSPFYSIFDKIGRHFLQQIEEAGHNIGLHFDPMIYPEHRDLSRPLMNEISMVEALTDKPCTLISQHQPSIYGLIDWEQVPNVVDVYAPVKRGDVSYFSDSNMKWRKHPLDYLSESTKIQLLIHSEYWVAEHHNLGDVVSRILAERINDIDVIFKNELSIMMSYLNQRSQTDPEVLNPTD